MAKKKSWVEKLNDSKGLPQVQVITEKMSKRWGTLWNIFMANSLVIDLNFLE